MDFFSYFLGNQDVVSAGSLEGVAEIEAMAYMDIAIAIGGVKIKAVIDTLESDYGAGCVEFCAALDGDTGRSLIYDCTPGARTPEGDPGNFDLVVTESGGRQEVRGFRLKSAHNSTMVYEYTAGL